MLGIAALVALVVLIIRTNSSFIGLLNSPKVCDHCAHVGEGCVQWCYESEAEYDGCLECDAAVAYCHGASTTAGIGNGGTCRKNDWD